MQDDTLSAPVTPAPLDQVYQQVAERRSLDRIQWRGEQLMTLVAELDEAVCDGKPHVVLREYIFAIEYIVEQLQTVCDQHRKRGKELFLSMHPESIINLSP